MVADGMTMALPKQELEPLAELVDFEKLDIIWMARTVVQLYGSYIYK
jgi:hypothetical protein